MLSEISQILVYLCFGSISQFSFYTLTLLFFNDSRNVINHSTLVNHLLLPNFRKALSPEAERRFGVDARHGEMGITIPGTSKWSFPNASYKYKSHIKGNKKDIGPNHSECGKPRSFRTLALHFVKNLLLFGGLLDLKSEELKKVLVQV